MKVFREKREAFGNKADFAGMAAIMRYYAKQGKCRGRATGGTNSSTDLAIVLLAGANKGESTSQVLRECEAKMHIFEIQAKLFEKQEKRFKDSNLVRVHRLGWSDRVQEMQITMPRDSHELAGLYSPKGKWKNALQLNETVKTIPLATFIQQELWRLTLKFGRMRWRRPCSECVFVDLYWVNKFHAPRDPGSPCAR